MKNNPEIVENIPATLILPFEFCRECLIRAEEIDATRYYDSGVVADIRLICSHHAACSHAVMEYGNRKKK